MSEKIILYKHTYYDVLWIKKILQENIVSLEIYEGSYEDHHVSTILEKDTTVLILYCPSAIEVQIIKKLQEEIPNIEIPTIVVTEDFDLKIMEAAFQLGAFDYISNLYPNSISEKTFMYKIKHALNYYKKYMTATYLCYRDEMTGLFNKRFFNEELRRLDASRLLPISIIVGDVNGLKLTNDVFGHEKGDLVITEIANVLKECCRKEDIVSRWGGDEFYILLPKTSKKMAEEICKRIYRACESRSVCNIPLSISLGYHTKERPEMNLNDIIRIAEEWMYKHKVETSTRTNDKLIHSFMAELQSKSSIFDYRQDEKDLLVDRLKNSFKLSKKEIEQLKLLFQFIDIGCIVLEDNIFNKVEKLSNKDWKVIKNHVDAGYKIAKAIPELNQIASYIFYHHERWDGAGYPHRLKGEEIPSLCRIVAILSAYHAMTHPRPYRKALSHEEIMKEIIKDSGTKYDPKYVKLFVKVLNR